MLRINTTYTITNILSKTLIHKLNDNNNNLNNKYTTNTLIVYFVVQLLNR